MVHALNRAIAHWLAGGHLQRMGWQKISKDTLSEIKICIQNPQENMEFLQLEYQFQRDELQQILFEVLTSGICHSRLFSTQNNPLFKVKTNTHQQPASDKISKVEEDSHSVPNATTYLHAKE